LSLHNPEATDTHSYLYQKLFLHLLPHFVNKKALEPEEIGRIQKEVDLWELREFKELIR
jgi:hypothetical protein